MIRKKHLAKLEKISETSSPPRESPLKDNSPNGHGRINHPVLLSFFNCQSVELEQDHATILHEKNDKLEELHLKIMDNKNQIDVWEAALEERMNQKNQDSRKLIIKLAGAVGKISGRTPIMKSQILSILRRVCCKDQKNRKKGVQELIKWLLKWVRELFFVIALVLRPLSCKTAIL